MGYFDVLVVGASLEQIVKAHKLAKRGEKVLLITSDTFLGTEFGRFQRPWISWDENKRDFLKFWLPIPESANYCGGELISLHPDKLKLKLEDRLLAAGVEILYGTRLVQIKGHRFGRKVILGFKGGIVSFIVDRIICETVPQDADVYLWTLDFDNVIEPQDHYILPPELGVVGNRLQIKKGAFSPKHYFLEIPLACGGPGAVGVLLQVAKYLQKNLVAFQNACLGVASLEPYPKLQYCTIQTNDPLKTIEWEGLEIPVVKQTEVLVVGGGTSGAVAAWVAAERGAKTILVEGNARLGGTGTIGGVNKYWFGRRSGFTAEIDAKVAQLSAKLGVAVRKLFWSENDCWHPEIKAYVLWQMCQGAGADLIMNSIAIGVRQEEDEITEVIFAGPQGVFAIQAEVVIDGTGDGDLAVFAGAPAVYGNERDLFTLWYSLAQYTKPGETINNFTTTVHVGDIFDYTRAILTGRRRGKNTYDHGTYLTPRESRHIVGEYTLTLEDQLLQRKFPDTINLCFSNHDPKGISVDPIILAGFLPPHLQIEIPFRALLPRRIDNLLIIGKAISASHDAFPAIRMQADLQNLGGAAGLAASLAILHDLKVRDIPIDVLQEELITRGVLPKAIQRRQISDSEPDYAALVNSLDGTEAWEWMEMDMNRYLAKPPVIAQLCFADAKEVVPHLKKVYSQAAGRLRLQIARLLAWHRDETGLPVIIEEIKNCFREDPPLPKRKGSTRFATSPPDHGVMPEVCYLLYTLARLSSAEIITVFELVVERILVAERDYHSIEAGIFHYIDSVAYCGEKQRKEEFIPLLEQLANLPELANFIVTKGIQVDIYGERLSYLQLRIQRALAYCGSSKAKDTLRLYLHDNRALLRESARRELEKLVE